MLLHPAAAGTSLASVRLQDHEDRSNETSNSTRKDNKSYQTYQNATRPFHSSFHPSPFPLHHPASSTSLDVPGVNITQPALPSSLYASTLTTPLTATASSVQAPGNNSVPLRQTAHQGSASEVDSADEYIGPARNQAKLEKRKKSHAKDLQQDVSSSTKQGPNQRRPTGDQPTTAFSSISPYQALVYPPLSSSEQPSSPSIADRPPSTPLPFPSTAPWTALLPLVKSGTLSEEQQREIWPEAFPPCKRSRPAAPAGESATNSSSLTQAKTAKKRAVITLAPNTRKRRRVVTPAKDKRSSSEDSIVSTDLSEESSAASLDGRPRSQRGAREYRGVALERRCCRMDRRRVTFGTQATQTPFLEAALPCLQADYYNRQLAKKHIVGYIPAEESRAIFVNTRRGSSIEGK